MRKIILAILLFISLVVISALLTTRGDDRPFVIQFKEAVGNAPSVVYHDSTFGYEITYPEFFEREDPPGAGLGHVQFGYHGHEVNITLECRVIPDLPEKLKTLVSQNLLKHSKNSGFIDRKATLTIFSAYNFILEGPVVDIADYRQCVHYVRHGRLWYISTLYYPCAYEQAVKYLKSGATPCFPHPKPLFRSALLPYSSRKSA